MVDVNTIERIEIIRGPQGSTLYGSDAAGGVMQIFTKKGSFGDSRPRVELEAAGTSIESPYADGRTLEQRYAASVHGGTQDVSYRIGGTYRQTGDWAPEYSLRVPAVHAGARLVQQPVTVEVSARYTSRTFDDPWDPRLRAKGWPRFANPPFRRQELHNQTYGVSVLYAASEMWEHRATAGFDRITQEFFETRPRVTDGLFQVFTAHEEKVSVGYNTSLRMWRDRPVSAVVTLGADHFELNTDGFNATGARTNSGSIVSAPTMPAIVARGFGSNTGYFSQAQLAFRDAVFLTLGLRAERNTNFGGDYGTAVSPRVGASIVRRIASSTLKLRASYGEGIRPPAFGINVDRPGLRANPDLGPEEQRGGDVGFDVEFGTRGAMSATYYNQRALGLIDGVLVDPGTTPPTFQFQNVGKVRNAGVELEGRVRLGRLDAQAQFSTMDSEVRSLSPSYTGELRIGDQLLAIPRRSAGGSLAWEMSKRTTLTGSVTHLGEWTNRDVIALFGFVFGGEPFRGSIRAYWMDYPAVTKLNAGLEHRFTSALAAYFTVENLANEDRSELSNFNLAPGRRITIGARFTPDP